MTTDGTLTADRRGTPAEATTGPVSYGQERLWYLDRFEGAGASYNVPEAYRLRGPLDAPALARALSRVVARHPALRARFVEEGEEVFQRIDPPAPVELPVVDLSGLPAERRDGVSDELARLEANRSFDLVRGRLLRARLIRLEARRHDLLLTVHHAVTDGWSHGILREELGTLYDARVRGVEAELPEPSIDYLEWVRAERDRLGSEALREGLEFWRERLAGVETLELPTDRPRREARSFRGATLTHELPATIGDGVRALSRAHRSSGFMVLLAGFEALLLRSTDQRRVAVGLPVANRKGPEAERLIAYLVNMVALPADLSGDPSFVELLGRVRGSVLDAYPHLHVPFGRLVEELRPRRRLGRTPLFQVSFQIFHEELEPPALTGLEVERLEVDVERAKFDLDLAVFDQGDGLTVRVRFSRDLFDDTTVARLLGHLESLLTAAVQEPERRLGALPVLTAAQRHQVAVEWSTGATSGPAPEVEEASLGELFAGRAAATPDAVAVVDGGRHVTYGALERCSAALAARLRELGVGLDTPVGLAVERSAELVVGVLGIVRAGGGYVPLDASYPEERLAFVLEDLELPVLVADAEGAERVPQPGTGPGDGPGRPGTSPGPTTVVLSRVGPGLVPGRPDPPPALAPAPSSLAYVVYTSGSTGRPKGVAVPHRAVVRLVRGSAFARFGPEETFLQLAPVAFDASTLELWGPLLHGGRLVLAPPGPLAVEELAARVAAERVTTLWLTAGLFHQVAEAALGDLAGVRQLLAGGDVLAPEVCRRVLTELAGTRLINGYGPTENTTFTCCHPIGAGDPAGAIPIGRPVARTSVYAVDRNLRLQPAGVPGELVTGGAGVARGYAGRPALTAERFVPDPFAGPGSPGARLYRTGDRVRVRPDGVVEFLGRLDRQVKVRGFRIEPGEIEAALTAHPAVAEAAVVARKPSGTGAPAGDEQLVAYLVPADDLLEEENDGDARQARQSLTRSLRGHLSARLPGSMVPSVLAFLEELPLGPTGKVDRAGLALREVPADASEATASESAEQDPPKTPTERTIAATWRDLLGLDRVGATDDFFRCGGHSLLATRLLTRLRRDFGVELPLQELFADPTVRGLAERVERRRRPAPSRERTRSRPRPRPRPRRARRTRLVRSGGRRGGARRREATGPLSYGQERLWYLDRFEGAGSTYNVPEAHRFLGSLDAPALARALARVVGRHDALRAHFVEEGEGVVQRIEPPGRFPGLIPLPVVDLTGLPPGRRPRESERILWSESNRPFDLARGPLLRARLVRRSRRRHDFFLVAQHAVTDGWSRQVVLRELETLYGAFTRGQTPDLPEPSLRYLDWAREERRRLEEGSLNDSLEYWREQLAGVAPLELPADRPRPAVRSFRGFRRSRSLPATLGDGVQELCREHRASPFMVLLAGFEALLLRFTAQERGAVGLPVANRDRTDTQDLVGYCVNMMGLPVDLTGDPTFLELLGRVRTRFLEAYAHRHVPFGRVVEEVRPERDASRTPLFQVTFQVLHDDLRPLSLPGLAVDVLPVELDAAKFDLELAVVEERGELVLRAYASEDLFEATTVDRLLGYLANLYRRVVEEPGRRVHEVPILSAAERHQLLVDWNARAFPTPMRRLDAAVREQAHTRPDAVAVVAEGEHLTYGALARRAARLRDRLVAAGVGTETPVGLFFGRSAELATAVLAVLEAGGCFVPLDPSHPAERLAFMVQDCGAPVVVTRQDLAAELPDGLDELGVRVVRVDGAETDPVDAPEPAFPPEGDAGRLAYVLYTSGSTGRPKGVACAHLGVVNLLSDFERRRAIRPGERCGWWTSPSFDVTIYEVFSALTAGATLCPVPDEIQPDGPRFVDWLAERRVASAYVPPFALPDLAERAGEAPPLSSRLLVGVEPIDEQLLVTVAARCPGLHVVNGYGPTEATVCATLYDLPESPSGAERTPIGRPVHNDRVYLLDERLEPVPRGVPGELFIGGPGLARGYAGRPARTAEAFVPDPFAGPDRPGARLYRTGDHARHLRSGDLLFLGRLDQQVKVRGMRIELGEVEAALMRHDRVRRVLAMVRDAPAGDRRLVAYAVASETPGPEPEALRRLARESLPEPMVPSAVVVVDRLPLTPTGKVDRDALPEPAWQEVATGGAAADEAPRTETERLIAGIWCRVLGIERRPGRHDDFFDLGGHSLLGTRVVARIRSALGIELPIRKLFQNPTIAGLAAAVEEARRAGDEALPPLRPVPRDGKLPLSFSQLRQWFLVELEPRSPVYNLPLALRLAGPLHRPSLERALQGVVARHEVLRTRFESVDGRPVQRVARRVNVPLPLVDLSGLPTGRRLGELEDRTAVEARRPFDLARVPLLRCLLFDLGDGGADGDRAGTGVPEHLLWLNVHHIVFDGWSFDVFTRDLAHLYQADRSGEAPSLPELPVQYADYAHWQRHELVDRVFARQIEYWRGRLADAPARLTLPTDRPRPAVQSHRGGSETLEIPAGLTGRLRRLAVDQQGTLFMVLLAAYQALLARWSGQEDLSVGTFVANRPWTEIESLVGFFVNTLVLRADLSADPAFEELLDRIRACTLEAYENQDLPFERLLDVLETERDLSKTPLFQAMFGLQNYAEAGERLPDLDLRPVRLRHGEGRANADLALWVWEREDRMDAWLRYSADLFDATTVRRFLGHFRSLLEAVVEVPTRPLSELPLLGPAERHQILWEWNPPEPAPAAGETVLDLLARRADERPDAPAVVDGERVVTYGGLRRGARGLARRLMERGLARPDAVVAVRLERSAELVVSILGILEAGCCYLPVDPSVPAERAAAILEDAGARLLIGDASGSAEAAGSTETAGSAEAAGSTEAAGAGPDVPLLWPEPPGGEADSEAPGRGALEVPPEALAYVIYTSGTTGTPKGVPVDHRALRRFTDTAVARYRLGPGDRVLQFAAPSFDASVEEIFPTLACGAALVLRDETMLTSPQRFFDECARRRVTVADLPTAWWHELAGHVGDGAPVPDGLRLVIIGGEAALPEAVAAWLEPGRDGAGPSELVNTYGPTEATVVTTAATLEAAPNGARSVPIGRPIDHARVHVLSPELRPVPVGVAGELALGGTGVARGYLGRPGQTARTFVPDPFAGGAGGGMGGARLYRSGDLGRYLPDGSLEFLGRIDRQVKVRGYRVEPEGVAAVLAGAPGVREAVVVPHRPEGGDGGGTRLVGYFVPADGTERSATELIRGLRTRLPEYMVPAELIRLESMPLTRTGKVDRAALPEPGSGERAAEEYAPPETATEEALAAMWEDLLGVDRVGLHDDFFDLGGHSLLAPQLIARIDEALGVELPLAVLFEAPTLGRLAVAVEETLMEEIEALSDEEAERLLDEDPPASEL